MYQTWRSLCGIYNAHKGVRVHATTDWRQRYCEVAGTASLGDDLRHDLPFDMVDHIIILPNYKEEMDTLCETLDVLASHSMALTQYKVQKKSIR